MKELDELEVKTTSNQARRWCFTINNPLGIGIEEIDITKTDLEIKEDYYNLSYLQDNLDYFNFKYVLYESPDEEDALNTKQFIVKRPFFKSIEAFREYLTNLEHWKYSIFQYEKGESGTPHFQGFLIFKIAKRFSTMKLYFPFAHFEKCKGSSAENREYCSKSDTKISGPYEDGEFAEERARTDVSEFLNLVQSGASKKDLAKLSGHLYLKERTKIEQIYADTFEDYATQCRDVDVTYIYGDSGVGKSTYIRRKIGLKNTFFVHKYDNSMFTNYKYQDNIVLDEFKGQIPIQDLNQMLDVMPIEMRGLNCLKYGAYHHVYIISNYMPTELYQDTKEKEPKIFKSFMRRLHKISCVDENGFERVERDTEWEECTNEIDREQGLTKQIKRMYEYDKYGNEKEIYNRYHPVQQQVPIDIPVEMNLYDDKGNLLF